MGSGRTGDSLLDALRSVTPSRVVVVMGDGKERSLALRTGRTRWQHAATTARALAGDDDGARVELRDAGGEVLHAVNLDADEDEPEAAWQPIAAPPDARDERMLTLLVSAQRAALEEQRVLLGPVLESYTALARGYAEYAAQVVELVRLAATVRAEVQESAPSPADAAVLNMLGQLGRPSTTNGAGGSRA
jgi:hypothetical protein